MRGSGPALALLALIIRKAGATGELDLKQIIDKERRRLDGFGFDFDPGVALFGIGLPIATFVLVILIYWKIKDIEKKLG